MTATIHRGTESPLKRERRLDKWAEQARREAQSRRESGNGLVVASYLSVRSDGRMVQLVMPGVAGAEPPKRGKIGGFSEDSRRRLMEMLHSLRRNAKLPVFVTLTFPEELTVTPREAKACLIAWSKRMARLYGARWCHLWRLEAGPEISNRLGRVHPHFHLLTWGAFYDFDMLAASWQEVVFEVLSVDAFLCDESGRIVAEKMRAGATNCERLRGWGGVIYCGKTYVAKAEEYPIGEDCGRVWGYWNRAALPLAEEVRIELTHLQATIASMNAEEWMREKNILSPYLVCTFFSDDPMAMVRRLLEGSTEKIEPKTVHARPDKFAAANLL